METRFSKVGSVRSWAVFKCRSSSERAERETSREDHPSVGKGCARRSLALADQR